MHGKLLDHLHLSGVKQAVFSHPVNDFNRVPSGPLVNGLIEQAGIKMDQSLGKPFVAALSRPISLFHCFSSIESSRTAQPVFLC